MTENLARKIRAKKLGVLLRDARLAAGKTMKDCAQAIGVSSHRIGAYERGEASPSLPELESLAFFLGVPLSHFWGETALTGRVSFEAESIKRTMALRQRIIGAKLRSFRQQADVSMKSLATEVGITAGTLRAYERGEKPIPLPELEAMLRVLQLSLEEFRDQTGPAGQWATEQENIQGFTQLPPEMQAFVARPVNRPYLELAMRLSEMSAERLRAVAEGLLDITF